jgi:hypothetical protein
MLADGLADDSAPDPDWPIPTAEVRRLLEPVAGWSAAPGDDGERDDDQAASARAGSWPRRRL